MPNCTRVLSPRPIQFHFGWSEVTPLGDALGVRHMWSEAFAERSLMFMNGGPHKLPVNLSGCRKPESLNVVRVNGSLTDCCLLRT